MYRVLATIDLNLLDTKSQIDLYKTLMPLYKSEFKEDERIIFECSSELTHTYKDLPADLLIQLQKMLVYIDIPNYFCIVKSHIDLSAELEYINQHYAVGDTPIRNILEDINV